MQKSFGDKTWFSVSRRFEGCERIQPFSEFPAPDLSRRKTECQKIAAVSLLTLEVERDGDVATVKCHGKLVLGVCDVLACQVRALIPDTKRIVLDLTDLKQMDSMGLGTIVRLYASAKIGWQLPGAGEYRSADSAAAGNYEFAIGADGHVRAGRDDPVLIRGRSAAQE